MERAVAGAALGALTGLLLGLSVSETVASILAALIALVGAVLGIGAPEVGRLRIEPRRVIAFCAGFLVAVVLGLLLRTHNVLGVSVDDQIEDAKKWIQTGLSPEFAAQIVTGVSPRSASPDKAADAKSGPPDPKRRAALGILSNTPLQPDECADLDPSNITGIDNKLRTLEARGLAAVAARIRAAPQDQQELLYKFAWELACKP